MQINKVTRRWPVSHTYQTPTIWKLSLGYDFNQTGACDIYRQKWPVLLFLLIQEGIILCSKSVNFPIRYILQLIQRDKSVIYIILDLINIVIINDV